MKYGIDTLIASISKDNKADIRKILDGDIYDVIRYSESGLLMDEKEAREEFAGLYAEARELEDVIIEVRIPVLVRGEPELEEDVTEGDEPFYYLSEYEEIDRKDFDEKSWKIFHKIGF